LTEEEEKLAKLYISKRDRLIPLAAALADELGEGDDWGYIYFNEMDRLAFETGLIKTRLHKPLGRGYVNPRERRNT